MAGRPRASAFGPLDGFAEEFVAELAGQGYAPRSSEQQLRLLRDLSRWLAAEGLAASDLGIEVVDSFVAVRRQRTTKFRSSRALVPLLAYLRARGVAPEAPVAAPAGPVDALLERFARYLAIERGLATATVSSYRSQVRPFLVEHVSEDGDWMSLSARAVADFITERAHRQRPRSVAVRANALRALLRWMWREGIVPAPLADAVGSVAAHAAWSPRKSLSASEVHALFAALPAGPVRLRDEPMLALMCRLGLRAGEVASLRIEDIDWRAGMITVRGKSERHEQMPLPVDVGRLLVAYLQRGRPTGGTRREVFLGLDAPHRPLTSAALTTVASRALVRAGISGPGAAHRLRHTAACSVLAAGGGLMEVGQLLRHRSAEATAVYAKSDLRALAVLARPWPLGGAR
ncbi:MAG: tyrosine-type recombinase/integrase [Solirubrobacteraceae bacterium]|jgi:site-specific recombinase XerD